VMGFAGLTLAWHRAIPLMGEAAQGLSLLLGLLTAALFVAALLGSGLRFHRHPEALADDLRHPLRHAFVAALPAAGLLLASVLVTLFSDASSPEAADTLGLRPLARGLWWVSSLGQLGITLWVMQRWWNGPKGQGLTWSAVTPALMIPVVGNVLAPLAGVPLGHAEWSAAQFGLGVVFWPVVLTLLMVRLATQGLWPERTLPSSFILIAPPAVIGLSSLQLGAPLLLGWMLWGVALFTLLWVGMLLKRMGSQPFGMAHWGVSFPLAALSSLTLRLAETQGFLSLLGPLLLALTTLVFCGLTLATVRGLREGTLLAPEAVASIQPVSAP